MHRLITPLLLLALSCCPHATPPATRPAADADPTTFLQNAAAILHWYEPEEPCHLIGPIYFVGTKGLGSFLITTDQGLILLNSALPGYGPMIEASIRKLGFEPKNIKLLLAGHAHVDHVGSHAYLQRLSGARVAMLDAEAPLLESGGKTDFQYGRIPIFFFDPVKVDQRLKDGEKLPLGNVTLTAHQTPGHTPGSTTFTTTITVDGQPMTVAFPQGTGVNPGYRLVNNCAYPAIADDYRHTFQVLGGLTPQIWFTPHNENYNFPAKRDRARAEGPAVWVDPCGYRTWVDAQRKIFEARLAQQQFPPAPGQELLRTK